MLSALASATSRMRLGVGCMATFVHRHPVMLAHQWASLDVLSGGRAWLAVCLGGPDEAGAAQALEHAVMGIRPASAWAASKKGSSILRKLFASKKASHHGRFYQFDGRDHRAAARPAPVPHLDRQQSHRAHLEGRGQRLRRSGGAEFPPRGALRRRLDDQQAEPRGVSPPVVRASRAMAREEGRDPASAGQRPLPQHQHQRGPAGRARGEQDLPRHVLHGQLQRDVRGGVDDRRAAPISAWTSSAPTSTRASRTSRSG